MGGPSASAVSSRQRLASLHGAPGFCCAPQGPLWSPASLQPSLSRLATLCVPILSPSLSRLHCQGLASLSHPGDPRGAADAPAGLALPGPRSLLAPAVVGFRASASPAPPGEAWRSLGGAHYPLRTVPVLRTPSHLVAAHPAATSLPALTRSPPAADSAVPHGHELLPASRSGPALAAPQPAPRSPHTLPC